MSDTTSTEGAPRPGRSFLRFSLFSLLLLVLLAGDGATIWWRWDAWVLRNSFAGVRGWGGTFSTDATRLVIASNGDWDSAPKCYDVLTGAEFNLAPEVLAISPDARWGAAFGRDDGGHQDELLLFNVGSKEVQPIAKPYLFEARLKFSHDSQSLLFETSDHALRLWKIAAKQELPLAGPQFIKNDDLGFTPDGKLAYALGQDGKLRLWNAATGKTLGELGNSGSMVELAVFSPDSRNVLLAYADRADIVALDTLQQHGPTLAPQDDHLYAAAFSPGGSLIATSTWGGTVRVWGEHSDLLATLKTSGVRINSVAFSPDAARLLTGGSDCSGRVFDVSGREILHLPANLDPPSFSPPAMVRDKPAARDVNTYPVDEANSGAKGPSELRWSGHESQVGHTDQIFNAQYSAGGSLIVTRSYGGEVRLWNALTGELVAPNSGAIALGATSDGARVAMYDDDNKKIQIWERRRDPGQNRLAALPEIWLGGVLLLLLLWRIVRNLRRERP